MATELSNYDNDYRLRYRNQDAANVSGVGVSVQYADYNVAPLPNEATYSMYGAGAGTAASPFNAFPGQTPTLTAASFAGMVDFPKNDGLGAIEGRYSLEFTDEGEGAAGFNITSTANPPAGPSVGRLWFDTSNLQLMVYIDDGTSTQWVAAS